MSQEAPSTPTPRLPPSPPTFVLSTFAVDEETSPAKSSNSALDSGVDDVFDSPHRNTSRDGEVDVRDSTPSTPQSHLSDGDDDVVAKSPRLHHAGYGSTRAADESPEESLPKNPFDNEKSNILFEAIDQLQTRGLSSSLNIPQLVIVGSQSSGKSSLLQNLTKIPFPVGSGCCTRFPTRIVSHRTAPGTRDFFSITIGEPEVNIPGLGSANESASEYRFDGDTLDVDEFAKVMEEVSSHYMGISHGRGSDKKNFVANVLKIEVSGPKRSPFSIIDLPGIFTSDGHVNTREVQGVRQMVVEYMAKPENIVICVADASYDLDNQEIFTLSLKHADANRLVGVFTKCDMPGTDVEKTAMTASGKIDDGSQTMHNDWFVVRNRGKSDPPELDIAAEEEKLFGAGPWASISRSRRGSVALKTYLGDLLSKRIRAAFPEIVASIEKQLSERLAEKTTLGDPRDSHSKRQQYLSSVVQKFASKAKLALEAPGCLGEKPMELRKAIHDLNYEFDNFMRTNGHVWMFAEDDLDLDANLAQLLGSTPSPNVCITQEDGDAMSAFCEFERPRSILAFRQEVESQLSTFQANQLPGIVSPNIYPAVYSRQAEKWAGISEFHLKRCSAAVQRCLKSLLDSVCPPTGATSVLNHELTDTTMRMFNKAYADAQVQVKMDSQRETQPEHLQTTNPEFGKQVMQWRMLRYIRATDTLSLELDCEKMDRRRLMERGYHLTHASITENMMQDIHDVLKVYYQLSRESFIYHIIHNVIEKFVTDSNGPLKGLNMEYVLNLSEKDVERLAAEDDTVTRRRSELQQDITKLEGARAIAEKAKDRTRGLGAT